MPDATPSDLLQHLLKLQILHELETAIAPHIDRPSPITLNRLDGCRAKRNNWRGSAADTAAAGRACGESSGSGTRMLAAAQDIPTVGLPATLDKPRTSTNIGGTADGVTDRQRSRHRFFESKETSTVAGS